MDESSPLNFSFTIPNLDAIIAAFKAAPMIVGPILVKYLNASSAVLSSVTGQNTPYQSGRLITSFQFTPATLSNLIAKWAPSVDYALFVEQGTGVYGPTGSRIYPKNARALANVAAGWGPYASIAGMQGRHYMEKILAAATGPLTTLFGQAGNDISAAIAAQST